MPDPGSMLSELRPSPSGARVQSVAIAHSTYLLVSGIRGAGATWVSIEYSPGGKQPRVAALAVANGLVGCRLVGSNP